MCGTEAVLIRIHMKNQVNLLDRMANVGTTEMFLSRGWGESRADTGIMDVFDLVQ